MKRYLFIALVLFIAIAGGTIASLNFPEEALAQGTPGAASSQWLLVSGTPKYIKAVGASWGLQVPQLASCDTIDTDANGKFSCGTDAAGAGASFPFTPATNYGVNTSATTTALWAQGALFASSTTAYPTLAVGQAGAGPAATFIGGNVGVGTVAPTHSLTLNSTGTGYANYNTADQVTNYERFEAAWISNTFNIGGRFAGSGTSRNLAIGVGSSAGGTVAAGRSLLFSSATPFYTFGFSTGLTGNLAQFSGSISASSGNQNTYAIIPTVNQSGTASYTGLLIQPTITAIGSGTNYLLRVGTTTATDLLSVTHGGQVGIASTTPWARLSVDSGSLAAGVPSFAVGSSTRTDLVVTQAGNVGIGTTSPTSLLNISASDAGTTLTSVSAAMLDITNRNTTNNNFADLAFSTADAAGATVVTSKIVGVNTSHTAGATSGALTFLTRAAGTIAERMRISPTGLVGIGTTTPNTTLTVSGSGANGISIDADTSDSTQSERLFFKNSVTGFSMMAGSGSLQFRTGATPGSSSGSIGMTYTSSGLLGVGTTSPWGLLSASSTSAFPTLAIKQFGAGAAAIFEGGNVGIGSTTPNFLLSVGTANAGKLAVATSTSGCAQFSGQGEIFSTGSACGAGAGTVTSIATNNGLTGGTITTTGTIGLAAIAANSVLGNITGASAVPTAVATSSLFQNASASITGLLSSTDWSTFNNKFTLPALTSGSVLFSNGSTIAQDNASFFWDDTKNILGLGTTTPNGAVLVIASSTAPQLSLTSGTPGVLSWVHRVDSNGLYTIGTSSPTTYATNTPAAISISSAASSQLGIGTTSPWRTVSVTGTMAIDGLTAAAGTPSSLCMNATTKEVTLNAALTCTVSSLRFKHDVQNLDIGGLDTVLKLRSTTFFYNDRPDRNRIGLIAEELADVDPRLSEWDEQGRPNSIDFPAIMGVLIKSVQEIASKNDEQDEQDDEQDAEIALLRAEIEALKGTPVMMCSL